MSKFLNWQRVPTAFKSVPRILTQKAQSPADATMIQRSEEIQDTDSRGRRGMLKYDMRELRLRPENIPKRYQEQEQEADRTKKLQSNEQQQEKFDNAT